jgi:hypothetical protein
MAPEQARGDLAAIGPATDVYGLGAILYHLLTGRAPFPNVSPLGAMYQVLTEPPTPPRRLEPGVPGPLEAICLKCLSKQPSDRYAGAAALADDLRCFREEAPTLVQPPRRRTPGLRKWAAAGALAAALAAGLALVLGVVLRVVLRGGEPEPAAPKPPWKGSVDVRVDNPKDPDRHDLGLGDPAALPLKAGDEICVEVELNRPAYVYVLWIDTAGGVLPVYPWRKGNWDDRPAAEKPVRRLRQPEALNEWYPIEQAKPGMETLVLLARETPLPRDVDLRAELGRLPRQDGHDRRAVVWFENGVVVRGEPERAPRFEPRRREDPVLTVQQRIRERLQRHFDYTRAVSFAVGGK